MMANMSDKELMGDGTNTSKETYPPDCKEPAKICPIMSFKPKTGETGSVLVHCFGHECMAWQVIYPSGHWGCRLCR